MHISGKPLDAARMTRAQAELARVEARLKQDALKADVIARIVSDTAKNKDILDRPAAFTALAQDPDSIIELARQAGWVVEESHVTGTEMRRAGTLLGSLLNAFQIPSDQNEVTPSRQARNHDLAVQVREEQSQRELAINLGSTVDAPRSPSIVSMSKSPSVAIVQITPQQRPILFEGRKGPNLYFPFAFLIQFLRTANPFLFIALTFLGMGLFVWLYL